MIRILKGIVTDPISQIEEKLDIEIADDGIITKVSQPGALGEIIDGCRVIDANGCLVAPGFMDVHVHFRDPGFTYKEDLMTGSKAAVRGGFTDVVMMANTKPAVDSEAALEELLSRTNRLPLRVHVSASATKGLKGQENTDIEMLTDLGAVGITDDGIPIMDEEVLRISMVEAGKAKVPLSLHEEDKTLIKQNGINHGEVSEKLGIYGSPREAEISLTSRDLELLKSVSRDAFGEERPKLVIQHISTKEGVELVRRAQKEGFDNVYAEATPHHFTLTQEAVLEYGAYAKMNPPLRTNEDREAIIEGIKDGTIGLIATDHAPHSKEEKEKGLLEAPSGIIGLETAYSLAYEKLVKTGEISLIRLLTIMCVNPRKLYGLPLHPIKIGEEADLVIIDNDEKWIYEKSESKSFNSPFKNREMSGKIKMTICKGEIAYEDL